MEPIDFSSRVLAWFERHGRKDLPWQRDPAPYRVWVSEIMLQQTRVATVIPYYQRFMEQFPDVATLANAEIDQVLHFWSGLGYYARARNLHKAAQDIQHQHGGVVPADPEKLQALPGIGRSTAAAILALSHGERHAILDGNVKRVLARFHAVTGWPGKTAVMNQLWELAERYTPDQQVPEYTQAMMDLGATVCTRTQAKCEQCPLSVACQAWSADQVRDYPSPKPKRELPVRNTTMLLVRNDDGDVLLVHRPPAGIWGGLWSFPEFADADQISAWCQDQVGSKVSDLTSWPGVRHTFSHFHLDINPVLARIDRPGVAVAEPDKMIWYKLADPDERGLAAPVQRLLHKLQSLGKL